MCNLSYLHEIFGFILFAIVIVGFMAFLGYVAYRM